MTPEILWARYSAIWSLVDADARAVELDACLADDATYCDPNGLKEGRAALSDYMDGFQKSVPPGARFRLRSLLHHNDRTLTHWALIGPDEIVLQTGTSYGALSADGRLRAIAGFFDASGEDRPSAGK